MRYIFLICCFGTLPFVSSCVPPVATLETYPGTSTDMILQLATAWDEPLITTYVASALEQLEPGTDEYYLAHRYVAAANVLATAGSRFFNINRPKLARQYFYDAIRRLQEGISHRRIVVQEKAQGAANLALIANLGALGSAVAGASGGGTGSQMLKVGLEAVGSQAENMATAWLEELENTINVTEATAEGDAFRVPVVQGGLLSFIGQLVTPDGRCSAFQVRWRIVVTNAHCVVHGGRIYRPAELRIHNRDPFLLESFLSADGNVVRVTKVVVSPEYVELMRGSDVFRREAIPHDWAVLVTDRPLNLTAPVAEAWERGEIELPRGGNLWLHYGLELRDMSDVVMRGSRIAVAGYSGDINDGKMLMIDYGCPISDAEEYYRYKCSTYSGNSGGPIFAGEVGTPGGALPLTVIGVNSCGRRLADGNVLKDETDRSKLSACGLSAARVLPAVETEFQIMKHVIGG